MRKSRVGTSRRAIAMAGLAAAMMTAPLTLTGCFGGGSSEPDPESVLTLSETDYLLELGAVNDLCNHALKFTITDMQRRPVSTFAGSDIAAASTATQDRSVSAAATDSLIIQLDVSYTWNQSTYLSACQGAGVEARPPSTLGDVLRPGYLMYIEGIDDNGDYYSSGDVVIPEAQSDVNQLAINAQWDYAALNSTLPETSVTKSGSILMRVTSTAKNLRLVIYTPISGQDISNDDSVGSGEVSKYILPLT